MPLLHQALKTVSDTVAKGGRVLFVGTKRQASGRDRRRRQALGAVLRQLPLARRHADQLEDDLRLDPAPAQARRACSAAARQGLTKKERLMLTRERDKLEKALGGIKDMGGTPDLMFVIDTNKEALAIKEAKRLGIPVVAILDTNCDPDGITFPIPGNDDAGRAIALYCDLIARAAIDGISRSQGALGIDLGAAEAPVAEALPEPSRRRSRDGRRRRSRPSSCWPRRAARRTISPSCTASARRSSRSSTTPASSITGSSPR